MGFFQDLGRAFGFSKSKDQGNAPAPRELITPLETKQGKFLEKTLRDRIAGVGLGFTPEFISETASPFAVSQRRALRQETIPTISAQASARGVGRSTIPTGQIGRESNITEQNIAERIANLGLASENLRAQQQGTAIGRYGNLTLQQTNAENLKLQAQNEFERAEFLRQRGYREAADAYQNAALNKTVTAAIMAGTGAAAGAGGALPGIDAGGMGAAQGAIAGLSGDFDLFKPTTPLFGSTVSGSLLEPSAGKAATVDVDSTGELGDLSEEDLAFLRQILK